MTVLTKDMEDLLSEALEKYEKTSCREFSVSPFFFRTNSEGEIIAESFDCLCESMERKGIFEIIRTEPNLKVKLTDNAFYYYDDKKKARDTKMRHCALDYVLPVALDLVPCFLQILC